jgi:CBS domain-containing protein
MSVVGNVMSFAAGYAVGAATGPQPPGRRKQRDGFNAVSGDTRVREVMTIPPATVTLDSSLTTAACLMANEDIGDVIVTEPGTERVAGIVTDRDIAIRAVAEGRNPDATTVEEIFSRDLAAIAPTDTVRYVMELMQGLKVRRLPVVDADRAVGFVSLGDLSLETDVGPTLAEISSAAPDH